jgi:hypothetical protein
MFPPVSAKSAQSFRPVSACFRKIRFVFPPVSACFRQIRFVFPHISALWKHAETQSGFGGNRRKQAETCGFGGNMAETRFYVSAKLIPFPLVSAVSALRKLAETGGNMAETGGNRRKPGGFRTEIG